MAPVLAPGERRGYAGGAMTEVVFESTRTMSQAEFAVWVEQREIEPNRYELLNGRVVMTPPAGYPHGQVEASVASALRAVVVAGGLGKVFASSQGFALPSGDTVAADVSFVSRERWQAAPPPEEGKFPGVVPDLVVEILSTSTASRDRGEKKAIYAKNAVREYWLVDTRAREVLVFTLEGDRYGEPVVYDEGLEVRSGLLAELRAGVAELLG